MGSPKGGRNVAVTQMAPENGLCLQSLCHKAKGALTWARRPFLKRLSGCGLCGGFSLFHCCGYGVWCGVLVWIIVFFCWAVEKRCCRGISGIFQKLTGRPLMVRPHAGESAQKGKKYTYLGVIGMRCHSEIQLVPQMLGSENVLLESVAAVL